MSSSSDSSLDWTWQWSFDHEPHRATFAVIAGQTFLYDGVYVYLLDAKGTSKRVLDISEIRLEDPAFQNIVPCCIGIAPTGMRMACGLICPDGRVGNKSMVVVFDRRGKPLGRIETSEPIATFAFDGDNVVAETMYKEESPHPDQYIIDKKGELASQGAIVGSAPIIDSSGSYSIKELTTGEYEILQKNRVRGKIQVTPPFELLRFSPSGKTLTAITAAHHLVHYTLEGDNTGTYKDEEPIQSFCYTPDGSIIYTTLAAVTKLGHQDNLLWTKPFDNEVLAVKVSEVDEGYSLIYIEEPNGTATSWVLDLFGNLLLSISTSNSHETHLYVRGKSLWIADSSKAGMVSLYSD